MSKYQIKYCLVMVSCSKSLVWVGFGYFFLGSGRVRVYTFGFLSGSGNYSRVFRVLKNMENLTPSFIFIAFLCTNVFQNSKRWEKYFFLNKSEMKNITFQSIIF